MIRLGVFIASYFVWANVASAEVMRVRTGEHGEFTRLVLAFDALPSWRAGRTETGYAVEFSGTDALSTVLSRVFALIDRARIDDVAVDPGARRVDIGLGCACHAEIFDLNGVTLVIDIRDGATGPDATHEVAFATAPSRDETGPVMAVDAPVKPILPDVLPRNVTGGLADRPIVRPPVLSPLLGPAGREARAPETAQPRTESSAETRPVSQTPSPSFAQSPLPTIGVIPTVNSNAVEALTEQLGRAASQGLVDVAPFGEGQVQGGRLAIDGPQNFRTFTSVDRAVGAILPSAGATASGQGCIPDRYVDVGRWGDPKNAKELGKTRQGIVRETGAVDLAAMKKLARYYVALGFGAEARFSANHLPEGRERAVLLALADIVDQGESGAALFQGQLACPGKIALWSALAQPFKRSDLPVSTDTILTTFSALPPHLREHLGPVLSQRLRNVGETALARAALSAVTRVGSGSVGQELTAARLELLGTRADDARAELERLAQGTNVVAADALVELLLDAQRRKVPPKPEWVDDAEALIRVTNGTRTAEQLSIQAMRGHIPLGRFDNLRRALWQEQPGLTEDIRRDIAAEALAASVQDADATTFLRTELGLSDFASPDMLGYSKRYEMVERFLDLGLARRAAKYLPEEAESAVELGLMAATIAALDRQGEALALIQTDPDQELAALRAGILGGLGRHTAAASLLNDIGEARAAELQALRSGDWSWIAERGPTELAASVRQVTSPVETAEDAQRNSALIDSISTRRAAYLDLLGRTQSVLEP